MAEHARLRNEFAEDEKCHNLMSWLKCVMVVKVAIMMLKMVCHNAKQNKTWATICQNQQSACAPSEDSDQPGHPPSLIRVFAVQMKKAWVLSYLLSAQQRLWSDWAHSHFVGFVMSRLTYKNMVDPKNSGAGEPYLSRESCKFGYKYNSSTLNIFVKHFS